MLEKTVLDNGIRIISEKMPEVRSATLGIWVSAGSRNDPKGREGMAHFTEHMLFKGTARRSAVQIAKEIDALGGVLNAQTAKEYTVYYTRVLDEYLGKASDVLFDLFLESLVNTDEMEKEKKVVVQEIRMTEDTPDDYITDLFAEAFFQKSTLGIPILGSMESVGSIRRKNILDFISSLYAPESIIVAAVGNLDHSQLVDLASPGFNNLKKPAPKKKKTTGDRPKFSGKTRVFSRDIEQVHITMGTPGASMGEESRWAYIVLNTILGGSMSSMLFQEAREKLGLVYSIYSYMSSYRDCGVLATYAATTPDHVRQTIDVIAQQMEKLKKGDFGGISIEDVKTQIKGNLLLSRESTVNRMSSLAKNEIYYGREVTVEEVIGHIEGVNASDVVDLAQEIFQRSKITMVTLGKLDEEGVGELPLA
jgi:predicted Zn-dependent peptidase